LVIYGFLASARSMSLAWTIVANAQTDALVVEDTGFVGVNTAAPDESIQVLAVLKAPFVALPPRCGLDIPVKIQIVDAETAETLVTQEAFLSSTSRLLSATLPPDSAGRTFQVGVITNLPFVDCLTAETSAVSAMGIRRLN
jgi:hypothetical protein